MQWRFMLDNCEPECLLRCMFLVFIVSRNEKIIVEYIGSRHFVDLHDRNLNQMSHIFRGSKWLQITILNNLFPNMTVRTFITQEFFDDRHYFCVKSRSQRGLHDISILQGL